MSDTAAPPPPTNLSVSQQLVKGVYGILAVSPCLIFFYINCVMLFTLRSKPVFYETSRYILLYNLLFADTFQLALGQVLYVLASAGLFVRRYVCAILTVLAIVTTDISAFNLAVMSLERFIAVCFPLRHSNIVTIRNTGAAIAVVWSICSTNTLVRFVMLVFLESIPFNQRMKDYCSKEAILRFKVLHDFDKGFICFIFVSVGFVIICSYIGVIVAAKSASSDKALASKARNTVLLHMTQLFFTLSSNLVTTILVAVHGKVDRALAIRINYVLFVFLVNGPRCLSSLIYGLRDQTIRPILLYYLSCGLRQPPMAVALSDKH